MNLLEKYKVLANTRERDKVKKGFIEELPAISAQSPSVGNHRVAAPTVQGVWENSKGFVENPSAKSAKLSPEKKITPQNPSPKGTPEARQQVEPEPKMKAIWPPEIQLLIGWFLKLEPREIAPFYLEPHLHVTDPVKFCAALRREVLAGPTGPRGKHGALLEDVRKLKELVENLPK